MADMAELRAWWMDQAEHEIELTGPKAVEYGSYDLELIGSVLADLIGWENPTTAVKEELGCWFYALGKVARMASAYKEHRLPSDDTPFDGRVYFGMIQRIREMGSWPGEPPDFKPCQPVSCGEPQEESLYFRNWEGAFTGQSVKVQKLDESGGPIGEPLPVKTVSVTMTHPPMVDPMNRKLAKIEPRSKMPGFCQDAKAKGYSQMWLAEDGIGWQDMQKSASRSVREVGKPIVLHKHDIRTECPGVDVVSIDESYTSGCYTMRKDSK